MTCWGVFTVLVERPFAISWTAHTPKFMLIGLFLYGGAATLYLSTKENRRPGEEHGSARWGSPRQLCAKYRDKDPMKIPSSRRMSAWGSTGKSTGEISCKS